MEDSKNKSKDSSEKKSAPPSNNFVWYVLGFLAVLLLLGTIWGGQDQLTIQWSDLEKLIAKSDPTNRPNDNFIEIEDKTAKTSRVLIINAPQDIKVGTTEVTGTVMMSVKQNGQLGTSVSEDSSQTSSKRVEFHTDRLPNEQELTKLLSKHKVPFSVAGQPSALLSYLMPLMLFGMLLLLMIVMLRRMGGAGSPMAFGRSRAKMYAQEEIEESFDDVAGVDEAVDELRPNAMAGLRATTMQERRRGLRSDPAKFRHG